MIPIIVILVIAGILFLIYRNNKPKTNATVTPSVTDPKDVVVSTPEHSPEEQAIVNKSLASVERATNPNTILVEPTEQSFPEAVPYSSGLQTEDTNEYPTTDVVNTPLGSFDYDKAAKEAKEKKAEAKPKATKKVPAAKKTAPTKSIKGKGKKK